METSVISPGESFEKPKADMATGFIPVRGIPGLRGVQIPVMGQLPATYYKAEDDGFVYVPASALLHAEYLNNEFRQIDKATEIIEGRARAQAQRENSMGRLEGVISRAVGGQGEMAKEVAATFAALMPAMMKEMRDQVRAEMMSELGAQTAPKGEGDPAKAAGTQSEIDPAGKDASKGGGKK